MASYAGPILLLSFFLTAIMTLFVSIEQSDKWVYLSRIKLSIEFFSLIVLQRQ